MNASELMAEIQRRQIRLAVDHGSLRYQAPKGSITPELRQAIGRYKFEIIALLGASKRTGLLCSENAKAEAIATDACWHCHAQKTCRCVTCGTRGPTLSRCPGDCRACLGTGYLKWPLSVQ